VETRIRDAFGTRIRAIKSEGVELEHRKMGEGTGPKAPLVVEIDRENMKKDMEKMEIEIPVLTPRIYREYKNLSEINIAKFLTKSY
jgi:type III restriction enzyme